MTNYICINGNKAELTAEQMRALGIELPKVERPFERVRKQDYYCIDERGRVYTGHDLDWESDRGRYNVANYCTNKAIMEQRALHETLNRLLWRYSMEHDGDKIDWNDFEQAKYYTYYDNAKNVIFIDFGYSLYKYGITYFLNRHIAEAAVKEIIEPFMKAHPEFKW